VISIEVSVLKQLKGSILGSATLSILYSYATAIVMIPKKCEIFYWGVQFRQLQSDHLHGATGYSHLEVAASIFLRGGTNV
jgi:hypothetical protein